MMDKATAVLKGWARQVARASGGLVRTCRGGEKKKRRGRLEIKVVHETAAKRTEPLAYLRQEINGGSRAGAGNACPGEWTRIHGEDNDDGGQPAGSIPLDEEVPREHETPTRATAARSTQPRPRRLKIDAGAAAETGDVDTSVSPRNVQWPTPSMSKTRGQVDAEFLGQQSTIESQASGSTEVPQWRGGHIDAAESAKTADAGNAVRLGSVRWSLQVPPETSDQGEAEEDARTSASDDQQSISPSSHGPERIKRTSYCALQSQERFDSYVDAIHDEEAKRCSIHAVLSTDIARLVAELDVLHNQLAMANMRASHHRRAITEGSSRTRPDTWAVRTRAMAPTCSCGRRIQPRLVEDKRKRRTWHAGKPLQGRAESPQSETEQDVIKRHSAGTTLFRWSFHDGHRGRGRSLGRAMAHRTPFSMPFDPLQVQPGPGYPFEGFGVPALPEDLAQSDQNAVPRVDVDKSFDFRRECERIARRIRPTFAGSRV